MPNQEIINYIQECREKNMKDSTTKLELLKAGWQVKDIEEAMLPRVERPDINNISTSNGVLMKEIKKRLIYSLPAVSLLFLWYLFFVCHEWKSILDIIIEFCIIIIAVFFGALIMSFIIVLFFRAIKKFLLRKPTTAEQLAKFKFTIFITIYYFVTSLMMFQFVQMFCRGDL